MKLGSDFFYKAEEPLVWFAAVLWAFAVVFPIDQNGYEHFLAYLFGLVGCVVATLLFGAVYDVLAEVVE